MSGVLNFKEITPQTTSTKAFLVFSNPGVLDINLVKLLGVSVKESDNAIGFFGTGLKYALASTLRLGGEITIFSNGQRYDLAGEKLTLRDKEFTRVSINGEALGFTTELGKQWEPWMVVRELYSNALDENGTTTAQNGGIDDLAGASVGRTIIALNGAVFLDVWENRANYFLSREEQPLIESAHADVYPHRCGSRAVFYRGIRIHEAEQATCFRYNLKSKIDLTEDRTLRYAFQLREAVERTIITSRDEAFINKVLTSGDESFEGNLTFGDSSLHALTLSEEFKSVCAKLAARKPVKLNRRAIKYYQDRTQSMVPPIPVKLSPVQEKQLVKAADFIKSLGFADSLEDYPIVVVSWLGEHIYGTAKDGKIYLTKQAFDLGTKKLAAIIMEEFVHNHYKLYDESRELQSWLFERVITMGEEFVAGEPL